MNLISLELTDHITNMLTEEPESPQCCYLKGYKNITSVCDLHVCTLHQR